MQSRAVIEKLAMRKLAAAKCLLENEHYDDAYYLAGYSIELYLKAVICKTVREDGFFQFKKMIRKESSRAFKIHNYVDLFVMSGIQPEFEAALLEADFSENWDIIKSWNETTRYECDKDPDMVKEFVKSSEIICLWIQNHL